MIGAKRSRKLVCLNCHEYYLKIVDDCDYAYYLPYDSDFEDGYCDTCTHGFERLEMEWEEAQNEEKQD